MVSPILACKPDVDDSGHEQWHTQLTDDIEQNIAYKLQQISIDFPRSVARIVAVLTYRFWRLL
jgi:hypothetical protein